MGFPRHNPMAATPSTTSGPRDPSAPDRLESWKEIAVYLKRDIRTVQRWEKDEALPVRRHVHKKQGSIYAFKNELDHWCESRGQIAQPIAAPGFPAGRFWLGILSGAVAAGALAAWTIRQIWIARPKPLEIVARRMWVGPDPGRFGSVSTDGRYCSFTDGTVGYIGIRELATGRTWHVSPKKSRARWEGAYASLISPDARRLAYTWFNQERKTEIWISDLAGSDARLLYTSPDLHQAILADWSADGTWLLALLQNNDLSSHIVLLNTTTASPRRLSTIQSAWPRRMSLSPDGRWVAYDLTGGNGSHRRDIFVVSVEDGSTRRLIEHPSNDLLLGWSPAGRAILFASDRAGTMDVWMVQMAGGQTRGQPLPIKKEVGRMWPVGFARDGSYYYGLQTGIIDVYVSARDLRTGELAPPVPAGTREVGSNRAPDWSRDGGQLAYVVQRSPWMLPGARVVIRSSAGGAEREIRPTIDHVELLRWSADGRWLLVTGADADYRSGLFRVDTQTGQATMITGARNARSLFQEAEWTAQDSILYRIRDWSVEPGRLLARNVTRGQEREVLAAVYRFGVSPDAKWIAYSTPATPKGHRLMIAPAAGGSSRELFHWPGHIMSIAWSPDGRHVLFANRGDIWQIAMEGGEPRKLLGGLSYVRELRVHPSGDRVAFTAGEGTGELWRLENFLPAALLQ